MLDYDSDPFAVQEFSKKLLTRLTETFNEVVMEEVRGATSNDRILERLAAYWYAVEVAAKLAPYSAAVFISAQRYLEHGKELTTEEILEFTETDCSQQF